MPEDLYFGVRAVAGNADKKGNQAMHDECMELLKAVITDTPLTPADNGGQ